MSVFKPRPNYHISGKQNFTVLSVRAYRPPFTAARRVWALSCTVPALGVGGWGGEGDGGGSNGCMSAFYSRLSSVV